MKRTMMILALATAGVSMLVASNPPAQAARKAPASYAMCASCHSVSASGPKRMGPHLAGVYNRKAGTVAGYKYSPALKKSGLKWDAATLDRWLKQPRGTVPGNKMFFAGVRDPAKRAELINYMKTL